MAASMMFEPVWKQLRGASFTANRVLGLREQLGAIPRLIDDLNRDRFMRDVTDLVKFDRERSTLYAPVIISTNKQISAVAPVLIDAAIPDPGRPKRDRASGTFADRYCSLARVLATVIPFVAIAARADRGTSNGAA
jgi:hypothetical protein